MKDVGDYQGREQTYLKHFFLEHYLERVAYVIGATHPRFVYVDGFSGPWRSKDEAFEDTSFIIAINKLRHVREGLEKIGKRPEIRCLFIEKSRSSFKSLQRAIGDIADLELKALRGEFEELIPEILGFIGRSFSLVFIDPTGWTGFGLEKITPILRHQPGEVLVNFMFEHVNRFLEHPNPKLRNTIDELMGGPGWEMALRAGNTEEKLLDLYRERMRTAGGFRHVTSTRIMKPLAERSFFYLVYATRHVRGLQKFRKTEELLVNEQERVRREAGRTEVTRTTGQTFFTFPSDRLPSVLSYDQHRAEQITEASSRLRVALRSKRKIRFEEILGLLLEMPLVWESDVQRILKGMRETGEIDVEGLKPRERTVKEGHLVIYLSPVP
jgi:three-Cys-motif partner protein